ncbi:MAG: 30S ribosomal protein S9 [Planctomycetota bacterium]|nr:MAG: 30S ribosomal protein S9 [Planctomycetota bacterium]
MVVNNPWTWGLGRRKKAVARVRLKAGAGGFVVNGKPMEEFFVTNAARKSAVAPLEATENRETYDVFCNVNGGGITGQAGAVSLGIARALKTINPTTFDILRAGGLLTRDAREKERKKYGRRGARRGFQFSKR